MSEHTRKPTPLPRTVTTPDGATRLTGPKHMILPPLPGEVEAALERMRKVQHVNVHTLETDGVQSRVELLFLEQAPYGTTFKEFLKRNRVQQVYLPTGRQPTQPEFQNLPMRDHSSERAK